MKKYIILPLAALALVSCQQGDEIAGHAHIISHHSPVVQAPAPKPVVAQPQPAPRTASPAPAAIPEPLPHAEEAVPMSDTMAPAPKPQPAPRASVSQQQPKPTVTPAPKPQPAPRASVSQQQPRPTVRSTSGWNTPQSHRDQFKRDYPIMPGQNRGRKAR